jgi:hypothetical protein
MISAAGGRGGYFVALHEYRPELAEEMARGLGLDFFDFRAECMRPLGWEAGRMPAAELTAAIESRLEPRGLVVHNAEALLAAKSEDERRAWLKTFAATPWPRPVVVPIAIFQADLPSHGARFHRVDPEDVPAETLLSRLAKQ